ncbi:hypothetical protein [Pseudoteredinibacter isoporae]|uniref:Uncharacterized protein n=1 Tax=Pseudoteredinibacter isoporae TaxID=570281 RepID=A0A7X0JSU2_9GAMM|nr:hypothetical protein [Pseudoteredinibacter isoporae]MBB6521645.1 hypothetical protein [Pseudoteredinibacter isoporae]NHO87198.1 hypothetical protein [Pseudoteredinibacter isoporae]NIB23022.1 hypothetical protein [Pseudoteredinibacter isoporae]
MGEIRPEQYQLVFFFEGTDVSRQMLVEEFESVLDGFVPLVDYSGRKCQCAFLLVNPDLTVDAVVFFHLGFDISGRPDLHWNTPIKQLACQADITPTLSRVIRIASYSNCSIAWHQQKLWEPFVEQVEAMVQCVKSNQLGLGQLDRQQSSTSEIPALQINDSAQPVVLTNLADYVGGDGFDESMLEKQRKNYEQQLNLKSLEIGKLRDQHNELLLQLKSLEGRFEKSVYEKAQSYIEKRDKKWQEKLGQAKQYILQQNRLIKEKDAELESRTQMHTGDESLNNAAGNRFAQSGSSQPGSSQNSSPQNNNAMLKLMQDQGIKLQVNHPGIGSLHIPYEDVIEYLAAPMVYVANLRGVRPEDYAAWLQHRKNPRCQGFTEDGKACCEKIDPVSDLDQFVPGHSDFCQHHRMEKPQNESLA